MDSVHKSADTETQVRSITDLNTSPHRTYEDVAVEKLGHQATLPRTLTSRLGIIGTISAVVCPWPSALSVAPLCLSNGGTGGLVVGFIVSTLFMGLIYYLLAKKVPMYVISLRSTVVSLTLVSQDTDCWRPVPYGAAAVAAQVPTFP